MKNQKGNIIMGKLDKRALTEVYAVLLMLEKEKINQIPQDLLEGIKNNRDKEYEVYFDELENNMLPDTERILATIYTYYLANEEERNSIFQMIENEKKQKFNAKYGNNENFKEMEKNEIKIEESKVQNNDNSEIIPVKNSFLSKIMYRIKSCFKK